MTIEVRADELLRLTVDDIGDAIFIDLKDPENETAEHLAHLRKLFEQRAEKDQSRPVDAGELGDRLGRLPSRESTLAPRYRSSSVSTFDEEKDKEGSWREEEEAYRALVAEGGRPSHPVTLGRDVIDNPEEYEQYEDILWFWHFRGLGYHQEFRYQLIEWREFREYQEKVREFYVPRNRFQEYDIAIRESQANAGCKWDLRVLEDRHQQNRLEDWNEFRAFYYRKLKAYEKLVPPAEQNLLVYQKKFEDAQARLTDVITDTKVIYGRFDDIRASQKELAGAESRLESAQKALQAAELDQSKEGERAALMKTAQQELDFAKAHLKAASGSEEMRRLRDGYDLHIAEDVMLVVKGRLRGAQLEVKRWKVFLTWIDDQYPAIAAECGYSTSESTDVVSQLSGITSGVRRPKLRRTRQRKDAPSKSVLGPNSSSRISKPSRRKSNPRTSQIMCTQILPPTTTQQHPVEKPKPPRRSERLKQSHASKPAQVPEMCILSPASSSRVTKAKVTSSTTKRHTNSGRPAQSGESTTKWSGAKLNVISRDRNLRRSQRILTQKLNITAFQ